MKITDLANEYPEFGFKRYPSGKAFVYFICDEKLEIIYIGLTSMIYQRISVHYTRPEFFNMPVFYIETSIEQGNKLEVKFVRDLKPLYNIGIPPKLRLVKKREQKNTIDSNKIKRMLKEKGIKQVTIAEQWKSTRQNVSAIINSGHIPRSLFKIIANKLGHTVPTFKSICQ